MGFYKKSRRKRIPNSGSYRARIWSNKVLNGNLYIGRFSTDEEARTREKMYKTILSYV